MTPWYADNKILCSNDPSILIERAVKLILALNEYGFQKHKMFVDIVDVVTDVYYRVNKYRGHLTVYPEMAKIITYIENKGNK